MTSLADVVFNGKFLTAPPTGVHLVAHHLIKSYCLLNATDKSSRRQVKILVPPTCARTPNYDNAEINKEGLLTWQTWEQFELPRLARGRLIINLCNLGPIIYRNSITMIHDAQVFISPNSYRRGFRQWYRFALPKLGHRHKKILTVSEYSKQQLVKYGIADEDRITVVKNGVDHVAQIPSDERIIDRLNLRNKKYILGLANTQVHKNIGLLLRSFDDSRLRHLNLILFGNDSGKSFTNIGYKVPDNVIFAGRVTDGELKALINSAVCMAFPSLTEGFGLPPLEAMSLGCPAILAPCGALPEICSNAAIYCSPYESTFWIERLLELSENAETRAQYSNLGRQQAAKFTWRNAAKVLNDVIESEAPILQKEELIDY